MIPVAHHEMPSKSLQHGFQYCTTQTHSWIEPQLPESTNWDLRTDHSTHAYLMSPFSGHQPNDLACVSRVQYVGILQLRARLIDILPMLEQDE